MDDPWNFADGALRCAARCRELLFIVGGSGGIQPGGFTTKLIEAALHADPLNLDLLSIPFPLEVRVIRMYRDVGAEKLERVADQLEEMAKVAP